ncbi:hypothetical protein ACYJW8_06230 [Frateuria aurantia]
MLPGIQVTALADITSGMTTGQFAPQFPVPLIKKDFGETIQAAGSETRVPTLIAARGVFCRAMEHGMGQDNMTGVVKLSATPAAG